MQAFWRQRQFGGMGLAGQGYSREHLATLGFDITPQVRQRTAHANEVIYQHVFAPGLHYASKLRRASHARETISACVKHNIDLSDGGVMWPSHGLADFHGKCVRNGIDTLALIGMGTDQSGGASSQQIDKPLILRLTHRVIDQDSSRWAMPRLGPLVGRMLFHRRLGRVNQHVGEITPGRTRRLGGN